MTTRSDQDINASTSVHISKTATVKVSGTGETQMLEDEREAQLQDLQYREGHTMEGISYPISPSQDEVGALAYEEQGIHPRSSAPNADNRGKGGPTKPGMGGAKTPERNGAQSQMPNAANTIGNLAKGRGRKY